MTLPWLWYALPLTLLLLASELPEGRRFYPAAKLLASLAFVAVAVYGAAASGNAAAFRQLLPALLLCLLGDLALAFYKTRDQTAWLMSGMILFFLAQLAFIRMLLFRQPLAAMDLLLPGALAALVFRLSRLPGMRVGRFRPYALIYACALALFCAKSLRLAFSVPALSHQLLGWGSALFLVSDLLLFFRYFHVRGCRCLNLLCLSAYYTGMFLISSSLMY